MVVQSSHTILYLTSVESTTLPKTQQNMLVQSSQTTLYLYNFCGTNSFIKNSVPHYGGAIASLGNTALSFTGTNNFISNSGRNGGVTIIKYNTGSIASVGTTTSSTTQHTGKVVQSLHTILHLALMEPTSSLTTLQLHGWSSLHR